MAATIRPALLACLAALVVAGCSSEPANEAARENDASGDAPQMEEVNEAAIGAPSDAHDDAPLNNAAAVPTDGAAARFVGRWAAKPELCEGGAWRFEEKKLATAGEVSCDFDRVTHVADGYDVAAKCLADGVTSQETIKLRFSGEEERMRVESKTFRPIELGRCGSQ